MYSINDC